MRSHPHQHDIDVHLRRSEAGVQAIRGWLFERQTKLNKNWPGLLGEELSAAQGEAKMINKLINIIDEAPHNHETGA